MALFVSVLSALFLALSIGVLLFFLHQVAWLVRYKNVQRDMMREASEKVAAERAKALPEWDAFAAAAWRVARGPKLLDAQDGGGAEGYARAVEAELSATVDAVSKQRSSVPLIKKALRCEEVVDETFTVIEAQARDGSPLRAHLTLNPPPLIQATAPADDIYQLDVASRYSFFRRALVFVTGLADVVYSARHVAKMSQYTHVPLGTIMRRLSLVLLLVVGIVLEVVLGMRDMLERWLADSVLPGSGWGDGLPPSVADNLPAIIALVVWTLAIATIYFTLFFVVRRKSRQHHVELRALRDSQPERLRAIRERHLRRLLEWASDYGRTLDTAATLTSRHIELLSQHYAARLRRRLAGPRLIHVAKRIGDQLLAQLPEASGALQDRVTTEQSSLQHQLWPRRAEMGSAVDQALYRQAWQHIELTLGELRRGLADPADVAAFWRQLASYAITFGAILGEDMAQRLRHAYVRLVEEASEATEDDLERFDASLRELIEHLDAQLGAATQLLAARVELSNQRIDADAAKLQAEIIRTREAARLEAMAFEI